MDLAALVGIVLAFGGIFGAQIMEGGSPTSIILVPPLILVICGTLGAAMAGGVLKDSIGIVNQLKRALTGKVTASSELVDAVVKLAERARREGLLALEDAAKGVSHPFLRRGLEMAIDGTDPEELGEIMHAEIDAKRKADKPGAKVFADMGGFAPTNGIIGIVLSLVPVLSITSDPA